MIKHENNFGIKMHTHSSAMFGAQVCFFVWSFPRALEFFACFRSLDDMVVPSSGRYVSSCIADGNSP